MNYVELKEFLRGLGLNTVTEYKNYAREKNAEKPHPSHAVPRVVESRTRLAPP